MLSDRQIFDATRRCVDMWNTLDLEATLDTYTDDVIYCDPKTGKRIIGKANLRRYLRKFFERWDMQFVVTEEYRLEGQDGQAVLWDCTIRRREGGPSKLVRGMDICMVRGNQLCRDEAYMGTSVLGELMKLELPAASL
ncbi:MAG TPA: nuclear transport factor 2 family protein [Ramlibacter sp.]|uniref:nuclear transport factor 2 family protein n=1 Tax=Ramlibacter sp. TaxID=1917967 RepID=UPI002C9176D5|nr:nuclear transport factor 2 family protein [Ramlibacter sp.]HVZ44209.1 nuclear transport factor 2 family protein [Ramlibacter sp.]